MIEPIMIWTIIVLLGALYIFVIHPFLLAWQHEKFVDSLSEYEQDLMGFYTSYIDRNGKIKRKRNWRR